MHQYGAYTFEDVTSDRLKAHLTTFEDPTLLVLSVGSNDIRNRPGAGTVEKLTARMVTENWKRLCAMHWPWVAFVDSPEVLRVGVDDPQPDYVFFERDGYHLNERGARVMAQELKNVVVNIPTRVYPKKAFEVPERAAGGLTPWRTPHFRQR